MQAKGIGAFYRQAKHGTNAAKCMAEFGASLGLAGLCSIRARKQVGQPFMWQQKGVPTFNSFVGLRIFQRNCGGHLFGVETLFLALLIVLAAFFLPFFPLSLWPAAPDLLPFSMFTLASVAGTCLLVAKLMLQSFQASEDSSSHFRLGMAHA